MSHHVRSALRRWATVGATAGSLAPLPRPRPRPWAAATSPSAGSIPGGLSGRMSNITFPITVNLTYTRAGSVAQQFQTSRAPLLASSPENSGSASGSRRSP